MKQAILTALTPVRTRQRWRFAAKCVAGGVAASAVAGAALAAGRLLFDWSAAPAVAALAVGPLVGLGVGLAWPRRWHAAAAAVDGHYDLKDRTVTALAFADQPAPTDLHALQLADAVAHLEKIEPKAVVPATAPRGWPMAATAAAVALGLLLWPVTPKPAAAGPAPAPEHIVAAAAEQKVKLQELAKKLADTTQDQDDDKAEEQKKGLKELVEKLMEKVEELSQPGTDEREALAKLSEMQADVQALANELNVAALDGQLSSLGAALAAASAFEGAGKALQEGKMEKAAKELEKIDEVKLTPKEAKALEEKLKQVAKQMGDAGQGALGEAVAELADGLKGGNGKVGKAARSIAKKANDAVKRRKLNDLLLNQVNELQECKGNCQNNGGARLKMPSKSESASSNWGRGISGNVDGEKTKLASKRSEQQVNGTPGGEGDSDVETTATPEARQQASRQYREKYQKFRKESDAVLEGEPIPLGHRQMVKKYFELIRPAGAEADVKKDEPKKDGEKK